LAIKKNWYIKAVCKHHHITFNAIFQLGTRKCD